MNNNKLFYYYNTIRNDVIYMNVYYTSDNIDTYISKYILIIHIICFISASHYISDLFLIKYNFSVNY